jgi:hypothetical protein
MWKLIARLTIASCCCWVLYRCLTGSTTGVPMSSWYREYQTATPPPYYPKATHATTRYCAETLTYYTTKVLVYYATTLLPPATTLTPRSITLPRATPTRYRSTTGIRMLPQPTTPRLPSTTLSSATYYTDC